MIKSYLLPLLAISISYTSQAQIPINDEPANAIVINHVPVGTPPNIIPGTTVNATYTDTPSTPMNAAACGCSGFAPSNPNDVWYRFNTGSMTNYEITVNSANYIGAPGYLRIYQDISNAGIPVKCYCSASSQQAVGSVIANGLSTNTDYFIAVSPLVGTNGFWGSFDINIFSSSTALNISGLFNFNAKKSSKNENEISWNLLEQNNIRLLEIQRKNYNNDKFEIIKTVFSETGKQAYKFLDTNFPIGGRNIYRLAAISDDNKKSYSKEIGILSMNQEKSVRCYPNPGSSKLNITREDAENDILITVYDYLGNRIFNTALVMTSTNTEINTTSWSNGIYYIQYQEVDNTLSNYISWTKR